MLLPDSAPPPNTLPPPGAITLAAYVKFWLVRRADHKATRTTQTYRAVLRRHVLPHVGDHHIVDITRGVIVQLLDRLAGMRRPSGKPYRARTVRLTYGALHTVLADAVQAGVLAYNPAAKLADRYPIPKDEAPCHTRAHVFDFLATANELGDEWATYFAVMFGGGLRVGETRGLQREDIRLATLEIHVARGLDRHAGIEAGENTPTKGHRRRVVPVLKSVLPSLTDLVAANAQRRGSWLFPLTIGRDGYQRQRNAYRAIAKQAGVPIYSPKAFRHAFGSTLAQLNVDIRTIQKFMGHADPRTTMRYADHYAVVRPPQMDEA